MTKQHQRRSTLSGISGLATALITLSGISGLATALAPTAGSTPTPPSRRDFVTKASFLGASGLLLSPFQFPTKANAAGSLADRLAARDASQLANSIFNRPPAAQVYPDFMKAATWDVESKFAGYLFPSTKIPKDTLMKQITTPGFQKCSIAAISDIGKEGIVKYGMRIDENGLEDRAFSLKSEIESFLGYPAIKNVAYNVKSNPNRISIDFVDYRTINAERIELFCNGRESEVVKRGDKDVFVCSEYIRQVTFGGGSDVGIPRQVSSNYAHYWTWSTSADPDVLTGNLLTAAYLDAQDPLFFDEPTKPVAVYSHILKATRRQS